jgi:hypothetical protein
LSDRCPEPSSRVCTLLKGRCQGTRRIAGPGARGGIVPHRLLIDEWHQAKRIARRTNTDAECWQCQHYRADCQSKNPFVPSVLQHCCTSPTTITDCLARNFPSAIHNLKSSRRCHCRRQFRFQRHRKTTNQELRLEQTPQKRRNNKTAHEADQQDHPHAIAYISYVQGNRDQHPTTGDESEVRKRQGFPDADKSLFQGKTKVAMLLVLFAEASQMYTGNPIVPATSGRVSMYLAKSSIFFIVVGSLSPSS